MTKIKSLYICNSNMFVPNVLTEVLKNSEKNYIIISDVANIMSFFEFLNLPNVILYKYGYDYRTNGIFSFIEEKRKFLWFTDKYDIGEIVFFHAEYGNMANWVIDKMSKRIPIKYCRLYDEIPSEKATISLRMLKLKIMQYVMWGQNLDIRRAPNLFPSLPQSFFKKVKAKNVSLPIESQLINDFISKKIIDFDLYGKYVLLTGTAVKDKWYSEEEYTLFINKIIEVMGKDKVVSKCHPRYNGLLYGKEKELKQIPSFIPGNLILEIFDYYVGVESTMLVEAAKAGRKAISIIDWLEPDDDRKLAQHEFFDNRLEGKGEIMFPTSMDEFIKIIG